LHGGKKQMAGAAGSQEHRQSACPVAVFTNVLIPQCGIDLLQAAYDGSPAPDQFPSFAPDPPLSNFHALPPGSAISFVVESCFFAAQALRQPFRVHPENIPSSPSILDDSTSRNPELGFRAVLSLGCFASLKQAPGHQLTTRKSLK
jgi:hypothetical protein